MTIIGAGRPASVLAPNAVNVFGKSNLVRPSEMASVRPRAIAIIASGTMNGTSLSHATDKPFNAPTKAPTANATPKPARPSATLSGLDPAMTGGATMPLKGTGGPTERQMPDGLMQ